MCHSEQSEESRPARGKRESRPARGKLREESALKLKTRARFLVALRLLGMTRWAGFLFALRRSLAPSLCSGPFASGGRTGSGQALRVLGMARSVCFHADSSVRHQACRSAGLWPAWVVPPSITFPIAGGCLLCALCVSKALNTEDLSDLRVEALVGHSARGDKMPAGR